MRLAPARVVADVAASLASLAVAGLAFAAPAAAAPPEPCGDLYVGTCFVHGEDGGYTCLAYVNQAGVEYCLFEHRP